MKLSYVFIYEAVVSIIFGIIALVVHQTLGPIYGAPLNTTAETALQ